LNKTNEACEKKQRKIALLKKLGNFNVRNRINEIIKDKEITENKK
jgi:hypothetical protein